MRAVVLLSGGLDSTTTFAVAKASGFEVFALSVDYGQRHRIELDRAAASAKVLGAAEHRTVRLDLRDIGGSALTADVADQKDRSDDAIGTGIPVTYVPARNTILLGVALSYAEVVGAFDLFIGANILDYSGHPDCRPEFLKAFEDLANVATKAGVEGAGHFRVHAPLLRMTKAEIIREGARLGVDFSLTLSCYDPDPEGRACGHCDSCQLRRKGFAEAGVADPTEYAARL
jgi:7-cyano-7-deazaguanine synthase